jgi:ribosomal protein L20
MTNKAAIPMTRKASVVKGALVVALAPKLAQDAKINLDAMLSGLTDANFKDRKGKLAQDLKTAITPLLAKDASAEGLAELLDALEKVPAVEGKDAEAVTDPNSALPLKKKEGEDEDEPKPWEKVRGMLKDKGMDAEMLKACDAEMGYEEPVESEDAEHEGETEEEKKARMEKEAKDKKGKDEEPVTKKAMDAAIKSTRAAVLSEQRQLREAIEFVNPWIGKVNMACDSASDVYRETLKALRPELDISKIDPSAHRAMIELIPQPGKSPRETFAQDSAEAHSSFDTIFPDAHRFA